MPRYQRRKRMHSTEVSGPIDQERDERRSRQRSPPWHQKQTQCMDWIATLLNASPQIGDEEVTTYRYSEKCHKILDFARTYQEERWLEHEWIMSGQLPLKGHIHSDDNHHFRSYQCSQSMVMIRMHFFSLERNEESDARWSLRFSLPSSLSWPIVHTLRDRNEFCSCEQFDEEFFRHVRSDLSRWANEDFREGC